DYGRFPDRYAMAGSVSYITGTHNVKVGIQNAWGSYRRTDTANGDIRAVFLNGVATTATILNSPVERFDQVHADVGVYAQDSWTLKRLTVNYGARFEHLATGIPVETAPAGRFTAARTFGPIDMPTRNSIAPRGGFVFDVFGNQKTAAKFSIGRYEQAGTTGVSERYKPPQPTTAGVSGNDPKGAGIPHGEHGATSLH